MSVRKRHTPKIKFQIILETFQGKRNISEISRQYGVHPTMVSKWKRDFLNNGHRIFEQDYVDTTTKKIEELETIIGKQTVEIQLLKKFLGHYASP
jgi:putative transposase